jgi:ABC-type lipoprotein export system ATPase subunit
VVMITHENEVAESASRIVLLRDGVIVDHDASLAKSVSRS